MQYLPTPPESFLAHKALSKHVRVLAVESVDAEELEGLFEALVKGGMDNIEDVRLCGLVSFGENRFLQTLAILPSEYCCPPRSRRVH